MTIDSDGAAFSLTPPGWVAALAGDGRELDTAEQKMQLVNDLARRNMTSGVGGPFAALVVDATSGEMVAAGVNMVLATGVSSLHAEVVALSLAQRRVGRWDLSDGATRPFELVVNWRPCAMCLGATVWGGITHLTIPSSGPELEEITGFDEQAVRDDWQDQLARRGITVSTGPGLEEALAVFTDYARQSDGIVYNAGIDR